MTQRTCEICGEPLTGRQTRYCCKRHRRTAHKRQARERGAAWAQNADPERRKVDLTCSHCGKDYRGHRSTGDGRRRNYCSAACLAEDRRWLKRTHLSCPLPWRACDACAQQFVARNGTLRCAGCRNKPRVWYMGWCIRDGRPFVTDQPEQRACSQLCARRHGKSLRRARRADAHIEIVYRTRVYERDNWTCRLCGDPVDPTAEVPEHLAPTLDHILPLAQGGDHSYANVQCAHFICNARKRDDVRGQLYFAA